MTPTPSAQTVTDEILRALRDASDGWTGDAVCISADAGETAAKLIETLTTSLAAASARIGELETFLRDFADWCNVERHKLGAVDGYDYRSGEEYGLRRAEIEIEKRIDARRSALSQTEEGR